MKECCECESELYSSVVLKYGLSYVRPSQQLLSERKPARLQLIMNVNLFTRVCQFHTRFTILEHHQPQLEFFLTFTIPIIVSMSKP